MLFPPEIPAKKQPLFCDLEFKTIFFKEMNRNTIFIYPGRKYVISFRSKIDRRLVFICFSSFKKCTFFMLLHPQKYIIEKTRGTASNVYINYQTWLKLPYIINASGNYISTLLLRFICDSVLSRWRTDLLSWFRYRFRSQSITQIQEYIKKYFKIEISKIRFYHSISNIYVLSRRKDEIFFNAKFRQEIFV